MKRKMYLQCLSFLDIWGAERILNSLLVEYTILLYYMIKTTAAHHWLAISGTHSNVIDPGIPKLSGFIGRGAVSCMPAIIKNMIVDS